MTGTTVTVANLLTPAEMPAAKPVPGANQRPAGRQREPRASEQADAPSRERPSPESEPPGAPSRQEQAPEAATDPHESHRAERGSRTGKKKAAKAGGTAAAPAHAHAAGAGSSFRAIVARLSAEAGAKENKDSAAAGEAAATVEGKGPVEVRVAGQAAAPTAGRAETQARPTAVVLPAPGLPSPTNADPRTVLSEAPIKVKATAAAVPAGPAVVETRTMAPVAGEQAPARAIPAGGAAGETVAQSARAASGVKAAGSIPTPTQPTAPGLPAQPAAAAAAPTGAEGAQIVVSAAASAADAGPAGDRPTDRRSVGPDRASARPAAARPGAVRSVASESEATSVAASMRLRAEPSRAAAAVAAGRGGPAADVGAGGGAPGASRAAAPAAEPAAVAAAEPMPAAPATASATGQPAEPALRMPVAEQVAERVRLVAGRPGQQIVIRLDPPQLGRVRLTFHAEGQEVRGVVEADSPRTLAELQREASVLADRLADGGVQLRRLDFQLSDQGRGDSPGAGIDQGTGGGNQAAGGQADRRDADGPASGGTDELVSPEAGQDPLAEHVADGSINVWM